MIADLQNPFVSSPSAGLQPLRMNLAEGQDETPIGRTRLHGLSTGLEANGWGSCTVFNRTAIAPLEYTRKLWMRSWVGLTMLFLYAPLIVLMIFSFNDSRRNIEWKGFTLKYYEKALE